jgi:hypothetical protein
MWYTLINDDGVMIDEKIGLTGQLPFHIEGFALCSLQRALSTTGCMGNREDSGIAMHALRMISRQGFSSSLGRQH